MPVKLGTVTEEEIRNIKVPSGKNVLEYSIIIDKIKSELKGKGYNSDKFISDYRTTATGNIIQGIINFDELEDARYLCIAWSSSYDKTSKFKLSIGIFDNATNSILVNFNDSELNRASNMEVAFYISDQIKKIDEKISLLKEFNKTLSNKNFTMEECGSILGQLFINKNVITISQLASIKKMLFPSKIPIVNCLEIFNRINSVLDDSHPSRWMDDHNTLYQFFEDLIDKEDDIMILKEARLREEIELVSQNSLEHNIIETKKQMQVFNEFKSVEAKSSLNSVVFI